MWQVEGDNWLSFLDKTEWWMHDFATAHPSVTTKLKGLQQLIKQSDGTDELGSPRKKEMLDLLRAGFRTLVREVLGAEEEYEQIELALDAYVDYLKLSEYRWLRAGIALAVLGPR